MYSSQQASNAANDSSSTADQNAQPPASKWFRDEQDDSSTDQVGLVPHNRGYKLNSWAASDSTYGSGRLRSSRNLAAEEEYTRNGKKRTLVKKRKRNIDDELSDEEEDDPYTQINIEDILSPIEVPTDIVRRSALKRIIKSPQVGELARTAMEFIENEKNYIKILSRLSAILHEDDPQYLGLTFQRTPEQRRRLREEKKKEELKRLAGDDEAKDQSEAATSEPVKDEAPEKESKDANGQPAAVPSQAQDMDVEEDEYDKEAEDVLRSVRELLLENINFSNEYLARLQGARDKLTKAHMQKEALWKQLKENARKEQDRRRTRHG